MSSPAPLPFEVRRAAWQGNLQHVVKWLRKGGQVDALCPTTTRDGQATAETLLHVAAGFGHLELVKELLERGASVNLQNSLGWTALMDAAGRGHLSVLFVLLQHSASIDLQDIDSVTALMRAADQRQQPCVKALLRAKANTELIDNKGRTALQGPRSRATRPSRSSSGSTPRRRSLPPPRLPPPRLPPRRTLASLR